MKIHFPYIFLDAVPPTPTASLTSHPEVRAFRPKEKFRLPGQITSTIIPKCLLVHTVTNQPGHMLEYLQPCFESPAEMKQMSTFRKFNGSIDSTLEDGRQIAPHEMEINANDVCINKEFAQDLETQESRESRESQQFQRCQTGRSPDTAESSMTNCIHQSLGDCEIIKNAGVTGQKNTRPSPDKCITCNESVAMSNISDSFCQFCSKCKYDNENNDNNRRESKESSADRSNNEEKKSRSRSKSPSPSTIKVIVVDNGTTKMLKTKHGKPFCIVQPGSIV